MPVNLVQQVGNAVPFEPGRCKVCVAWFQKPCAVMKHHRLVHSDIPNRLECSMYMRVRAFNGPHAALCHYSKCGGVVVRDLPHACRVISTQATYASW